MTTPAGTPPMTASVRILTLEGHGITRELYAQLPAGPLVHPTTGALRGSVWGRVHCSAGVCQRGSTHLHVVWQAGSILYRSCLRLRSEGFQPAPTERDEYVDALRFQALEDSLPQLFIAGNAGR